MLSDAPAAVAAADVLRRRLPGPVERRRCSPDSDQNPNSFRSAIRRACKWQDHGPHYITELLESCYPEPPPLINGTLCLSVHTCHVSV